MIEEKIRINIEPLDGELWSFIPEGKEVSKHRFSPYRYYVSNFGRVYDIQHKDYREWSTENSKPSVYLRDIHNKRCNIMLDDLLSTCFDKDQIKISLQNIRTFTPLSDDLIADIRNLYLGEHVSKKEIMDRYNVSLFGFQFAISVDIEKFKKRCIRKEADLDLSIQFMETFEELDMLSSKGDHMSLKKMVITTCDIIGIVPIPLIYSRSYSYYKGNTEYVLIPKYVQRLSEKE